MDKRFAIILGVIVLAFFGFLLFGKGGDGGSSQSGQPSNNVLGESQNNIILVEYADFQCPACASYFPVLQQVKETYKDRVKFQYKHLPLVQIHQNALIAARASEAAANQGKFWEMHDLLFQTQNEWKDLPDPNDYYVALAKQLSLDEEKFKTDIKGSQTNSTVQADLSEAKSKDYNSTPTFELNGQKLDNTEPTVEYFTKLLDEALKQNSGQ